MKRWVILVFFPVFLACPPVISGLADDTFDTGKGTTITAPLLKIPFGAIPPSNSDAEKKWEEEHKNDKIKEQQALDKKVDDAIRKAWEQN